MGKVLVCYFSASGVTRRVAQKIAVAISGDLFEIEPVELYTDADLNWMDRHSRSTVEMKDKSSRPQIKKKVPNIEDYDTIVIGFPVWWYTAPTIINTFIEENNLAGKNAFVFVTSGGSGSSGSFNDLKNKYPEINFIDNKRFKGNESDQEYRDWIVNNG